MFPSYKICRFPCIYINGPGICSVYDANTFQRLYMFKNKLSRSIFVHHYTYYASINKKRYDNKGNILEANAKRYKIKSNSSENNLLKTLIDGILLLVTLNDSS